MGANGYLYLSRPLDKEVTYLILSFVSIAVRPTLSRQKYAKKYYLECLDTIRHKVICTYIPQT